MFHVGKSLQTKHGKNVFKQKTVFILSNVPRCLESFKYFLLGTLSNSKNVSIENDSSGQRDRVNCAHDLAVLRSVEAVLDVYAQSQKSGFKNNYLKIDGSDAILGKESGRLQFDPKSTLFVIPEQHANCLFHVKTLIE